MFIKSTHARSLVVALLVLQSTSAGAESLPESGILLHEESTSERNPEAMHPVFPRRTLPAEQEAPTPAAPQEERLIERMDVYTLSPHAARLALPHMLTPQLVLAIRLGRASLPPPAEWQAIISRAAQAHGLPEALVSAVIHTESNFQPNRVSPKGAQGLMQLMPDTRRDLERELGAIDPFDPEANVRAGCAYLRRQLDRFGSPELALAAYNAGPGAVEKYGGIPPFDETQAFVRRVLERAGISKN